MFDRCKCWPRRRMEEYHSGKSDMNETIDDFDDGKVWSGILSG